jgi:hypothetical protein
MRNSDRWSREGAAAASSRMKRGVVARGVVLACIAMAPQARAQGISPPPRSDSQTPSGVSYKGGAFSHEEVDLAIGGSGESGLTLKRSYRSNINGVPDVYASTQGWTHSLLGYVSNSPLPNDDPDNPVEPNRRRYVYNVSIGNRSAGFTGGSRPPYPGGPVGTYGPIVPAGSSLVFNGTTGAGYYTFVDSDGTIANFTSGANGKLSNLTYPDGTRLDYTYTSAGKIRGIISNRGYAILFESSTKVCAVNIAQTYATATSNCPADAQTVTYGYQASTYNTAMSKLITATKNGATTTYSYTGADHLGCVQQPGQSTCLIQNQYGTCLPDPQNPYFQPQVRYNDPVISQQDASGATYSYSYSYDDCTSFGPDPDYRPVQNETTTASKNSTPIVTVMTNTGSVPAEITDALNRKTTYTYYPNSASSLESTVLWKVLHPEGNWEEYQYDTRGNIATKIAKAKPGSGLADIVTSAAYPSTCDNRKTCNKPTSTTDARGNTTSYTYSPDHGGMLTETGPAVNGVSPVKRYAYVQRYAWLSDGAGGYSPASSPVWLLAEERTCRTSATVGNACSGGAPDEVIVSYDYGPNSGPNNLLLRGKLVSADSVSLRTCYSYDRDGNRIWETSPRAGLSVCQ